MNLDAVRDALITEARRDAGSVTGDAQAAADARIAAARGAVADRLAQARATAAAEADAQMAIDRAAVRRRARRKVLESECRARSSLIEAAISGLDERRGTDSYDAFVGALARDAAVLLGPDADIVRDPPGGGVIATSGARRIDYTIPSVVERVVGGLGSEVEELWR